MRIQHIYVSLRAPLDKMSSVITQVKRLIGSHPGADVELAGLGFDDRDAFLSVEITVPISNSSPQAIAALNFAQNLNLSMFDYTPFYTSAPTAAERSNLETFLAAQPTEARDTKLTTTERVTTNA